ncbi:MAG: phosphodiester glycosidase family protein [Leptolyngbyaceae cyanobacterium CSU_1_3]|nr:phosphodiester glycosidase family protein [Leptolyngbyaceae cyanobacterium CSU_1_3]
MPLPKPTRIFKLISVAWLTIALQTTTQRAAHPQPALDPPLSASPPPSISPTPAKPLTVEPPSSPLAQLPSAQLGNQLGNQVSLNGRTFNVPWSQWQTAGTSRIGLSDAAIVQLLGAQLLSTPDGASQPIEWFPTAQRSVLTPRFAAPVRYLDITTLAQQHGWQLQTTGQNLRITTPTARLVGIRQGQQPFGDRIVIDLDRPTPWQIDPQSQEFVLTLDAQTDPSFVQNFKPRATAQVKSIKVEAGANQTTIRLRIPITQRSQISTLSSPSRIVIDLRSDFLPTLNILWTEGLRWRQQTLEVGSARFPVIWFEVNPRQPGLSLRPILPNPATVTGTASLIQTARQSQASAAINGGFFNRNNQLPLGAVRLKGQWFSGPILNRGVFAWNETGEMKFDRLTLQETIVLSSGQTIPLATLNSAYPQAGISRYTPLWGSSYSTLSDNEVLITAQNDRITDQRSGGKAGSAFAIPTNGYLLVARGATAAALTINTPLQLSTTTQPSDLSFYQNIVGAGPLLIQDRQIVLDAKSEKFSDAFIREMAARSAIGQTATGTLLFVSVHNRVGGRGATLTEIAQIMAQLGAVNALNLDGGSSTTLYLGGQILDRPPRSSARVHNGIGIFLLPSP